MAKKTISQLPIAESMGEHDVLLMETPLATKCITKNSLLQDVNATLSTKANAEHIHAIKDVTDLQTTLDGKVNSTDLATVAKTGSYTDLINIPDAYNLPQASDTTLGGIKVGTGLDINSEGILSLTSHEHEISNILGLDTTLDRFATKEELIKSKGIIYVDDYENINSAIAQLKDGYTLKFSEKIYNIDTINIIDLNSICIDFSGATILTNSSRTDNFLNIRSNNRLSTTGTIDTDKITVTLNTELDITDGDIIFFDMPDSLKAFTSLVQTVNGTTLTLTDKFIYNIEDTEGTKIAFNIVIYKPCKNIIVKNGTIKETLDETNNNKDILNFSGCKNILIQNMEFLSWSYRAIEFDFCYQIEVDNCFGKDAYVQTDGKGYFCRFGIASHGVMSNCIVKNVRHMFDCTNAYDIKTQNNTCYNSSESAFSLHGHYSDSIYSLNDRIIDCASGYAIGNNSFYGDSNVIIDGLYIDGTYGISVLNDSANVKIINSRLNITGIACDLLNNNSKIEILNCDICSENNVAIRLKNNSTTNYNFILKNSNITSNQTAKNPAIMIDNNGDIIIKDNKINGGYYNIQMGYTTACNTILIDGNTAINSGLNSIKFEKASLDKSIIIRNYLRGASNKNDISVKLTSNDILRDNNIIKMDLRDSKFVPAIQKLDCQLFKNIAITAPITIDANSYIEQNITTTGATIGDGVVVTSNKWIDGIMLYGYVRSVNTVQVKIFNLNSETKSIDSDMDLNIYIIKNKL